MEKYEFNDFELTIISELKRLYESFPDIDDEVLVCEVAAKLNLFKDDNLNENDKIFLSLYENQYLNRKFIELIFKYI